jgi:A/G-specific adenine glycosylase
MNKRTKQFHKILLNWKKKNPIIFPWRLTQDPYKILVAELFLHRTQVIQAERVYVVFIDRFPTLEDYASSSKDEIMKILYPLGLRWRLQGFIDALTMLWEKYKDIPDDIESLLAIPGIGPYISGATICFSQNKALALIDTNTVRVIGRLFGLNLDGEARRRKDMKIAIENTCHKTKPREYYYALIDFAHKICRANNPICINCPLLPLPCIYAENRRI